MQIEASSIEDIKKTLTTLEEKTSNIKPILEEIGNYLKNDIVYSFERQTTPDGIR